MTISYVGLGSNLGDRLAHLQFALDGLAGRAGTVVGVSAVYETEPMGGPAQPDYLNAVVALDTALDARGLLELAKTLEVEAGRNPDGERWGPRPLDIDILMVGDDRVEEADLVVPHPRIHQRGFVLAPLADVAPGVVVAPAAGWQGVRHTPLRLEVSE